MTFKRGGCPVGGCYRATLFGVFFVAISLTCGTLLNSNGVRAMWRLAGVPCVAGQCCHAQQSTKGVVSVDEEAAEPANAEAPDEAGVVERGDSAGEDIACHVAEDEMASWLKLYQSSEMIFAFTGCILDIVGPKWTFCIGEVMLLGSIVMMHFNLNWWAMIVAGTTTQLILNPTMCIGNVFGTKRNAVMAILSSGADISQYLWPVGALALSAIPYFSYGSFLLAWAIGVSVCAVAGFVLLPSVPFPELPEPIKEENIGLVISEGWSERQSTEELQRANTSRAGVCPKISAWARSAFCQLATKRFIVYSLIWMQMVVRLNAFLDSNEDILKEYGDHGWMGRAFAFVLPLSFVPCVFIGIMADKRGVLETTFLINGVSIVVNLLLLIPTLWIQWISVTLFLIFKGSLFTIMFCFVAELYGFENFGTLTAVMSLIGGIVNMVMGRFLLHLRGVLGSWYWLTVAFAVIGVIGQLATFYLIKTGAVDGEDEEFQQQVTVVRLSSIASRQRASVAALASDQRLQSKSLGSLSSRGTYQSLRPKGGGP